MRRKHGSLTPVEIAALNAAVALLARGTTIFHGFLLAKEIQKQDDSKSLMAHGTLYRALSRLEGWRLLTSRWEDPEVSEAEGRPRRRLYSLTEDGLKALAAVPTPVPPVARLREAFG